MFLQTYGDVASYSNRFYMLTHNMITNELYPVQLPEFPMQIRHATFVYKKMNKTLYTLHGHKVYSLDLDYDHSQQLFNWHLDEEEIKWKWKILNKDKFKLLVQRTNTCAFLI